MAPRRKIPDELAPELVRLAEVEQMTHEAIAEWLKSEHSIEARDETVRRTIWRYKGMLEALQPDDAVQPVEPADPEDTLQSLRYQLHRDAQLARKWMIADQGDGNPGKLYLGLQRLRVSLLCALRDKRRPVNGEAPQVPGPPPVHPVATFVVSRPEVKPS